MADSISNNTRLAQPSPALVNWDDERVVTEWCERFSVSAERLAEAVRTVGPLPRAVEYYLTSRGGNTKPRPAGAAAIATAKRELRQAREKQSRSRKGDKAK